MSLRTVAALTTVSALLLTGCGGDDGDSDAEQGSDETTTSSPSPSSTLELPAGVTVTEPGTELAFGEAATVEYSPTPDLSSALELTVRNARKGRLSDFAGFNLDDAYRRNANYYYVGVRVRNIGKGDLGGRDVPLHGVNAENTLLPPVVFESAFTPCPSERLPKRFRQGATFNTCLVYLSPNKGQLTAVSFRPDDTVNAITWTGEVQPPTPVKKRRQQDG